MQREREATTMNRIHDSKSKTSLKAAILASMLLLCGAALSFGQQVINLTAGPATTTMPDGSVIPMWGYSCGAAVAGSAATCSPLTGSMSAAATGSLGGIYVLNGGSGYSSPTVTIDPPSSCTVNGTTCIQASANAIVSGGQVVGFTWISHGAGYIAAPKVSISGGTGAIAAAAPAWSPIVITVPFGAAGGLRINLTNNLAFTPAGGGLTNNIPTSIVIEGQVGGGLGSAHTSTPSPDHSNAQGCVSWFIAALPPGAPCTSNQSGQLPPAQGPRVQSMATEVAAASSTSLTWPLLKPGTYLLESGTHPSIQVPMGLIGMLVVTTPPSGSTPGTAYPSVSATKTAAIPQVQYNAELPLEFSEIDPVQNKAVDQAVRTAGFSETAVWSKMNSDGVTALQLTNGGSGYTSAPSVSISGGGGSGASAVAEVSLGLASVNITNGGSGYASPTVSFSGGGGSGAAGIATVSGGVITKISLTSVGSGYTSAPAVIISDTSGLGAAASATLANTGSVVLTLTSGGGGYTSNPSVLISGGGGSGAAATVSVTLGGCGTTNTCYPPAVNYTPFYFLINGLAFDRANPGPSLFAAAAGLNNAVPPAPVTTGIHGQLLLRLVNAGLRMHVPAIVGSQTTGFDGAGNSKTVNGFTLIAEDGNPLPDLAPAKGGAIVAPRVKTEVFMAASKTYDVMVNVPADATALNPFPPLLLPIYDRELSLSANSSVRDAGMLAYIGVNGALLPNVSGAFGSGSATANPDVYPSIVPCAVSAASCIPFAISDPSKGVIANDINVYGVQLATPPTNGTLTCDAVPGNPVPGICANGTFTYRPNAGALAVSNTAFDTFGYCANGTSTVCAQVTLQVSSLTGGRPVANNITYTSKMATFLKIASPGVLSVDSDPNGLPLQVLLSSVAPPSGVTVDMDAAGGFTATVGSTATTNATCPSGAPSGSKCYSFTYLAQNSQGTQSDKTAPAAVTLVFPPPSNLKVRVLDAQAYKNCNGDTTCITGLPLMSDYRWIIEEDKTFWVDPNCTTNSSITTPGCSTVVGPSGQSTIPTSGVQFHTSTMDYVAQGCTGPLSCEYGQMMLDTNPQSATYGQHVNAVCDLGNGACRPDPGDGTNNGGFAWVDPSQVVLDPAKRYYISVLPGDAANPFPANTSAAACNGKEAKPGDSSCGHTMSGAPIAPACNKLGGTNACGTNTAFSPVNVLVLPTPLPTGKLSVMVFEDDYPLNGEQDGGGGNGTVAPIEPGLGGFNLVLWDTYGGLGDVTGQNTYDMFNQPLSNSLTGTIDPATGLDACPIATQATQDPTQAGIIGVIVTCPKFESDNQTLSPLAGQAVIANLMPEKFSVQAYPGTDRIARGEEWIQTNTLDGQHPHDAFIEIGDPSYFQEYGPAGYHVQIGFVNPAIVNARHDDVCAGSGTPGTVGPCTNTIDGQVDVQRLSRTPDQRLYPSGTRDALAWTQCWVSLGDPDGEDFMFTKCDANGNFKFANVPGGNWRLTIGDQWNDQIIDGLSTPANVGCTSTAPNQPTNTSTCPGGQSLHMGSVGVQQWQSNLYTKTCIDDNKNGICDPGEIGIPLIYTMIHYRDGHNANALTTDFNGVASFNETFPLFNWYVVEADSTRYKTTGIHTVYDAGGPADGSPSCVSGARPCGTSTAYSFLANTNESIPLPADLSVPAAVYCTTADCVTNHEDESFENGKAIPSSATASTGRIDPPWVWAEGWSGMTSQGNFIEFGKAPYAACDPSQGTSATCATVNVPPPPGSAPNTKPTTMQVGENGGIYGQIQYASTRPFDDPAQMIEQPWEPYIPRVTVNLYQENFAADGVTPTLTKVDTTQSSSWDDWAQGFYPGSTAGAGSGAGQKPYLNCPGQGTSSGTNQDLFYFTLFDQPNYLDWYNSEFNGGTLHTLPYNSQYKCYDSMHIWNQIQPAPYDGRYSFPSSLGIDSTTGKSTGTNCTICVGNPDSTDPYRYGTPMLPPGKYVVEVIMPPGYEVYKEEDKNLLIGDNFIAPVTQQFAGLGGDIFILPDQASVAAMYDPNAQGYNPNDFQNATQNLSLQGGMESGVPGFPGYTDAVWPCVGEMRVVPDFLSLFPQAQEAAPFAGTVRPLCDRKEVNLVNQMAVRVKFALFTSTHIAAKYTGVITDDFTSEFDPFAPQFGEKFSPPNMPIATRDYLGNELSRVYSDHWGIYDGLTFSSWDVNPPNITGYSPSMMTQCMNDPGPVMDANPKSSTYGQMIQDPLYNPAYSDFCYINPFMPGLTTYNDTPVVPTQAFVGAGYNNLDCSYPDATPAIKEVDGDQIGPWVSGPGKTLIITGLGDQQVNNSSYAGPSASVAPFNQKTITRHYGFGTQCTNPTAGSATCNTQSSVAIGSDSTGKPVLATIVSWSEESIKVTVPGNVPNCAVQQQVQYGNPNTTGAAGQTTRCGELVITAGNGKQSIDSVTVTVGGKAPTHVSASQTIQSAIDAAAPGDLIIVDPTCTTAGASPATAACNVSALHPTAGQATQNASTAAHNEMLIMWKPVRLQGVGAASSIIDASAFPAGTLLDPWRRHINCLFGLTLNGVPLGTYDSSGQHSCPETGWKYYGTDLRGNGNGVPNPTDPQVDRIPLEAVIGWDATLNGNLAEQLQEPSLMGAYEGAGITVVSKGVKTPDGTAPFDTEGAFPAGSLLLQNVPAGLDSTGVVIPAQHAYCFELNRFGGDTTTELKPNPYPSNFMCNPSSIDGVTVRDSSQGGGGIFVHGWAHNLQVANNRVYNNAGTLTGGINIGQGEFPDPITITGTVGGVGEQTATDVLPSCLSTRTAPGNVVGTHLPYCLDVNVNVHNNSVTSNSSLGDELFSSTLAGGGGATFCTGSDYYKFNYNWVCGNVSSAEGGGLTHLGFIYNGDIEHNTIALNQSTNPTIPTNGGGIQIMGTPDTDPVCTTIADFDCPPGLSDGTGPKLIVNANLIQANSADSGSGGGIRLQQVNGTEIAAFPRTPSAWNSVTLTNNIIVNNVAGWDGGGISLQDAVNVNIINNTISSNDTLASSGVLTQSVGTPGASAPAGNCVQPGPTGPTSTSCPQSAGVTSMQNSPVLDTVIQQLTITCPTGMPNCTQISNPVLRNNLIWQNRSFYIGVGNLGNATLNQQNLISLFNAFTGTYAPVQTAYGQCSPGASYWDIGVRGDKGPSSHDSGFSLNPVYSLLDDPSDYPGGSNLGVDPTIAHQYCNGSRVPPTCTAADGCGGPSGYGVPPGIVDASTPNPVFSLTPAATVDEGNNWINVSWGPLALSDDSLTGGTWGSFGGGPAFANYNLLVNSPAIDYVPVNATNLPTTIASLTTDFFGKPRPDPAVPNRFDIGAVEFQNADTHAVVVVTPTSLNFGKVIDTTTSAAQTLTLSNNSNTATAINAVTVTAPFSRPTGAAGGTCGATLAGATTCTINVVFAPPASTSTQNDTGTATVTAGVPVAGSPVALTGTGIPRVASATVSPSSLAFGAWAAGTTSNTQSVTVTNSGNVTLTGGVFTVTGATTNFTRVTTGTFPAGVPNCTVTLNVGAACTVKVQFAAGTGSAANLTGSLGVAYTTATGVTVIPASVALTGSRVANRATVTVTPSPLTITLPTGVDTGAGTVTLKNTSAAGNSSVAITGTAVAGGTFTTYRFTVVPGSDTCTNTNLAPQASCTVGVQFTNIRSPRGTNRAGTITFTDTATASPQVGNLIGHANP
jgi:hypothetical protein